LNRQPFVSAKIERHARPCAGHPCLQAQLNAKTWIADDRQTFGSTSSRTIQFSNPRFTAG
jgi:hypothetical protein